MTAAIDYHSFLIREARKDPRTLMELIFADETGTPIEMGDIHEDLHEFLASNQQGVLELPREHGKTTNMLGFAAFNIGINPNIRIKIVSSSDTIAVNRGKALQEIISLPIYRKVFPNIRRGREWADGKFSVRRDVITPESTVECYGVMSRATGGRCDLLLLDDVDDEEVIVSEAKRIRNRERVANVWLNLLPPTGRAFAFATPWHEADTVHMLKGNGWPVFRKPVVDMKPVWDARWHEKALRARKKTIGTLAFVRGYELVPITSETAPIKGEWFKYWSKLPIFTSVGIALDPANSLDEKADYSAIGVFVATWEYQVYLVKVHRARYEFPSLIKALIRIADQVATEFNILPTIGIEKTAFQNAIPQQLKATSRYPIIGVPADRSKFIRASRLGVHVENGRVHLKQGPDKNVHPDQKVVYDECVSYPVSAHDDCVDMLGYGVELMLRVARRSGPATG
ncbi:MAG: hypothetical protein GY841_20060 [FCB group bacterium]|nr:hypothetical protein [FCB group bacterium]